jgi:hypothetical protein
MDKLVGQWDFYRDHAQWFWRCERQDSLNSPVLSGQGFAWLTDCLRDARAHGYRRHPGGILKATHSN